MGVTAPDQKTRNTPRPSPRHAGIRKTYLIFVLLGLPLLVDGLLPPISETQPLVAKHGVSHEGRVRQTTLVLEFQSQRFGLDPDYTRELAAYDGIAVGETAVVSRSSIFGIPQGFMYGTVSYSRFALFYCAGILCALAMVGIIFFSSSGKIATGFMITTIFVLAIFAVMVLSEALGP